MNNAEADLTSRKVFCVLLLINAQTSPLLHPHSDELIIQNVNFQRGSKNIRENREVISKLLTTRGAWK